MIKKTGFLSRIILFFLCLAFFHIFPGYSFERKRPLPIPPHSTLKLPFSPESDTNFCTIEYDNDSVAYYFNLFEAGDGIAVYMDPEDCRFDTNIYPFKISNVYFYLYDPPPGVFVWPTEIEVKILNVDTLIDTLSQPPDTLTPVPGGLKPGYRQTFSVEEDSAYDPVTHPNPINLTLDEVWCVSSTFFLEITYTGGTEPPYPSLVMSDAADLPDALHNWVRWNNSYVEWYDFWVPWATPGRALMRVTGYPYAIDCDICWNWMSNTTQTPNGMPDFDQYQFDSDSALCGPTAVANCLVWLDAISSIQNPDSLIRLLSDYFHTDPDSGTLVDSITAGLDSLFAEYSLNLYSTQLQKPTYSDIVDSLINSTNTVLLVGLWQNIDETWCRIGGHYVSAAGMCRRDSLIAVSDPGADDAETGGRGRFLPPHYPHPDDHTLHNTKGFVSHDAYVSDTLSVPPYADTLWRLKDCEDDSLPWLSQFEGKNFQPEQEQYRHDYDPTESLYAVVEYAIMIHSKPPQPCWYWKPGTSTATNGTPDYSQHQFGFDSVALCAPTAFANCLMWLNAIPSMQSPDNVIRLFSNYFHTDPLDSGGTWVDSINAGLASLFADYSLNLYTTVIQNPVFSDIADSLKNSANTVLLLGLWQNMGDTAWHRIGGHYVSAAGMCYDSSLIAVSDPGVDNAEAGERGRVLPPHAPHPDDDTLHNVIGFVSHDAYVSDTLSVPPYADTLWRLEDCEDDSLPWLSQFEGQNFQPEQEQYRHDYDSTESLYAVVEYAIMIFEKPTLVEEEEGETPKYFELYQSFPNPFNSHTIIKYSLSKPTDVSLVIYNILGQKVRTLVRKEKQNGLVTVTWDGKDDRGRDLSSGIYFYQLQAGEFTQTRRMVLLK